MRHLILEILISMRFLPVISQGLCHHVPYGKLDRWVSSISDDAEFRLAALELRPRRGIGNRWPAQDGRRALKVLCELGGWKSPKTVLECYQQADLESQRAMQASRDQPTPPAQLSNPAPRVSFVTRCI